MQELKALPALAKEASRLYLQKDPAQREQTLLISPTRKLRDQINLNIKDQLELVGEKFKFAALRQKDMTIADYQFVPSFKDNQDILRFKSTI